MEELEAHLMEWKDVKQRRVKESSMISLLIHWNTLSHDQVAHASNLPVAFYVCEILLESKPKSRRVMIVVSKVRQA